MLFIVGIGLAKIFIAVPLIHTTLKWISIVYLLVSCWTFFGEFMRRYLQTEKRRRWFNYSMAALLVLSISPVLWE